MKDGDLFQTGLEPGGVRTCQDEVSTSSVCTALTKKTKHKTENTVNNTELALVLVLQHEVQAHGCITLITSNRMGSKKQLSTGISGQVLDKQILRGHVNRKLPRSPHSICDISHVQKQTSPIAVHMKLFSAKRRVNSNTP